MKIIRTCAFILVLVRLKECGKMEAFIVGGTNTQIDRFPHAVYLELSTTRKWICGAAVLNQDIVLTAAHCLFICVQENCTIYAFAGHESLYKVTLVRNIKKIKIHAKYDDVAMENDIALAKVSKSFPLGDNVHVKRIMIVDTFPNIVNALMAGWGITNDETKEAAVTLKTTTQVLKSKEECAEFADMNPGLFCAQTPSKLGRPSEGDSGSALVTISFAQIGVVSFRMEDNPSILYYTNVTYFYHWVKEAAQALYCDNSDSKFYPNK